MEMSFFFLFVALFQYNFCLSIPLLVSSFSSQANITDFFILYWDFPDSETIHIGVRWNKNGYFALGFGSGMDNVDIIACEKINGEIKVSDKWSTGKNTPLDDSNFGGKDDLERTGFELKDQDGWSLVTFKRKLNTNDKYDYVITKEQTTMEFAFSSSPTLSYHGSDKQRFRVILISNSNQQGQLFNIQDEDYKQAHAIGLLIVWTFLVEIPLISIRYFKNSKYYIAIHAYSFLTFNAFTLIMSFIMIGKNQNLVGKYERDPVITAHYICGYFIISLVLIQHFLGFIAKQLIESKKYDMQMSKLGVIKNFHKILGYFLYIFLKVTLLLGSKIFRNGDLFVPFLAVHIAIISLKLIAEILHLTNPSFFEGKKEIKTILSIEQDKASFDSLITDIETFYFTTTELLKKHPNLKWCMYQDGIYNLSDFIHPGGNFLIEETIGREIGRFFVGGYALESTKLKQHTHQEKAHSILKERLVGKINLGESSAIEKDDYFEQEDEAQWRIVKTTQLNQNISKFNFSMNHLKVKNYVKGVNWFGRHFSVTRLNNPKTRLYTTILCFTDENVIFRNSLIEYFEAKINKNEEPALFVPKKYTNVLPLMIKKYEGYDTMSSFIFNSKVENFKIIGPFGAGLELNENSNGLFVILAGGTGIFPFLDLLDYVLKKSIFMILKTKFSIEDAEKVNVFSEKFEEMFGENFRISLFWAVNDENEFNCLAFLTKLYQINQTYGLNKFDLIVRVKDNIKISGVKTTSEYFNEEFLKKYVEIDDLSRVFICGNPSMNHNVAEDCRKVGIPKDLIQLV